MALTLSQLANSIKRMFDHHFGDRTFWVVGEINSYKSYGTTRHFFDLIEKDADSDQVLTRFSSVIWANAADSVRRFESVTGRTLANGLEVLVKVRVTYTVQYGLKLTVEELDASFTLGQMERKRRETLTKLLAKHPNLVRLIDNQYVTKNKGLITAPVIQRIAVITSKEAAGFEDFVHSLVTNRFGYTWQLHYFFSRVQGQDAAYSIARRIAEINLNPELFDLIVIVRGGGAQTDLFVFDDFLLNRWIAASEVPVWVGIGHMRDQTIADLFSHRSFKTPTAVAEEIIHHNLGFEQQIGTLAQEAVSLAKSLIVEETLRVSKLGFLLRERIPERVHKEQTRLTRKVNTLSQAVFHLLSTEKRTIQVQTFGRLSRALQDQVQQQRQTVLANKSALRYAALNMVAGRKALVKETELRIIPAVGRKIKSAGYQVELWKKSMQLLDPVNVLRRGYALVKLEGRVISPQEVIQAGTSLEVETYTRRLQVRVEKSDTKTDQSQ